MLCNILELRGLPECVQREGETDIDKECVCFKLGSAGRIDEKDLGLLLLVSYTCFLRGYTIQPRVKHLLRVQCSRITKIVKRHIPLYTFWPLTTDKKVHFQIKWVCSYLL